MYNPVYAEIMRSEFELQINNLIKLFNDKTTLANAHDIVWNIKSKITDPPSQEQVLYPVDIMILIIIMARICGCTKAHVVRKFYKNEIYNCSF